MVPGQQLEWEYIALFVSPASLHLERQANYIIYPSLANYNPVMAQSETRCPTEQARVW